MINQPQPLVKLHGLLPMRRAPRPFAQLLLPQSRTQFLVARPTRAFRHQLLARLGNRQAALRWYMAVSQRLGNRWPESARLQALKGRLFQYIIGHLGQGPLVKLYRFERHLATRPVLRPQAQHLRHRFSRRHCFLPL